MDGAGDRDAGADLNLAYGFIVQRGGRSRVFKVKRGLFSVILSEPTSGRSYWLRK